MERGAKLICAIAFFVVLLLVVMMIVFWLSAVVLEALSFVNLGLSQQIAKYVISKLGVISDGSIGSAVQWLLGIGLILIMPTFIFGQLLMALIEKHKEMHP